MSILNRTFGCEFEFSTNFEDFSEIIRPIILETYGEHKILVKREYFSSRSKQKWHLKTDASTECELVSPISTIKDLPTILNVIRSLGKKDVQITESDSIHIHMSAEDVKPEKIIILWLLIEEVIVKCFKKCRRNNQFCPRFNDKKGKGLIASVYKNALDLSQEHHAILSLQYYNRRKTVEFRVSHATFDTNFIESWIKFCMYFLDRAKKIDVPLYMTKKMNEIKTPEELIRELNIKNKSVQDFVSKRC